MQQLANSCTISIASDGEAALFIEVADFDASIPCRISIQKDDLVIMQSGVEIVRAEGIDAKFVDKLKIAPNILIVNILNPGKQDELIAICEGSVLA